jgi:glycerol-3-phosphate acyltransferase PlsY
MENMELSWTLVLISAVAGYLFGSISFARIITWLKEKNYDVKNIKRDIPDTDIVFESDAISATAVSLNLGKKYGCLTSILDMIKAVIPTLIFYYLYPNDPYYLIAAIFGMFGHNYPVFYRFKGGSGQSPLIGGLLVINWFGLIIANGAAVILGYLTGAVLVMRWGWMVLMIGWFVWYFGDLWHIGYIVLANVLFWTAISKEIREALKIKKNRNSTQEEVSDFMLMGKGLGRFIDNYGFPALIKKALNKINSNDTKV